MGREHIEKALSEIFVFRFSKDFLGNRDIQQMKLLGKSLSIPARELLHVYYDVKRMFSISIPEEDIAKGRFDTFSNIVDIICKQLDASEK